MSKKYQMSKKFQRLKLFLNNEISIRYAARQLGIAYQSIQTWVNILVSVDLLTDNSLYKSFIDISLNLLNMNNILPCAWFIYNFLFFLISLVKTLPDKKLTLLISNSPNLLLIALLYFYI